MWWSEEGSEGVREVIERLVATRLEVESFRTVVQGVGSMRIGPAARVPLVIVNSEFDPRRLSADGFSAAIHDRFGPVRGIHFGLPESAKQITDGPPETPLKLPEPPDRSPRLLRQIRTWAAIADLFVRWPEPSTRLDAMILPLWACGQIGAQIYNYVEPIEDVHVLFLPGARPLVDRTSCVGSAKSSRGTVGVQTYDGYLTVGHGVGVAGSTVTRSRKRLFRRDERLGIGSVAYTDDAHGPATRGFDVARIVEDAAVWGKTRVGERSPLRVWPVVPPSIVHLLAACVVRGGRSGSLHCKVTDRNIAMNELEDPQNPGRVWRRVWLIAGKNGCACRPGDSGAAVHQDDALLGHVVAGDGWARFRQRYEIAIVQDACETLAHLSASGYQVDQEPLFLVLD